MRAGRHSIGNVDGKMKQEKPGILKWRRLGEAAYSNVGHGGLAVCVGFKFETKE